MTKARCSVCGKKLPKIMLQMYTCRCNELFCTEHKHSHKCTYDYKKHKHEPVEIKASKLDKI